MAVHINPLYTEIGGAGYDGINPDGLCGARACYVADMKATHGTEVADPDLWDGATQDAFVEWLLKPDRGGNTGHAKDVQDCCRAAAEWVRSPQGYARVASVPCKPPFWSDRDHWFHLDWLYEATDGAQQVPAGSLDQHLFLGADCPVILFRPWTDLCEGAAPEIHESEAISFNPKTSLVFSAPLPAARLRSFCGDPRRTYLYYAQAHFWRVGEGSRSIQNEAAKFTHALDELAAAVMAAMDTELEEACLAVTDTETEEATAELGTEGVASGGRGDEDTTPQGEEGGALPSDEPVTEAVQPSPVLPPEPTSTSPPSRTEPAVVLTAAALRTRRPGHNVSFVPLLEQLGEISPVDRPPLPEPSLPPLREPARPRLEGKLVPSHKYRPRSGAKVYDLEAAPCRHCKNRLVCIGFGICGHCLLSRYYLRIVDESASGLGLGLEAYNPACTRANGVPVFSPGASIIEFTGETLQSFDLDTPLDGEYAAIHSYGRASDGLRWHPSDLSGEDRETMRLENKRCPGSYFVLYEDAKIRRTVGGLANHSNRSSATITCENSKTLDSFLLIKARRGGPGIFHRERVTVNYRGRREEGAPDDFKFGKPGQTWYFGKLLPGAYNFPKPEERGVGETPDMYKEDPLWRKSRRALEAVGERLGELTLSSSSGERESDKPDKAQTTGAKPFPFRTKPDPTPRPPNPAPHTLLPPPPFPSNRPDRRGRSTAGGNVITARDN